MKTATTTAAQLEEAGRRLDASYHASDGIRAHQFIRLWAGQTTRPQETAKGTTRERPSTYSKRRLDTVAEVCMPGGIFIGGRAKRIYVLDPERGIPFLSSSDMLMASFDGVKLISRKQPELEALTLRKGWTLISRSGTIGNMIYAREDMDGLTGSEHIMRVVPDPKKIPPGYLFAYLSSPTGTALVKSGTFGSVIDTIEPDFVGNLPVPRLDASTEQCIHGLIEQSAMLRVEANRKLVEAKRRFLGDVLHILPSDWRWHCANEHAFAVSAVRLNTKHHRLDAFHYAGYAAEADSVGIGWSDLGDLVTPFQPPIFKRPYTDKTGIAFLSGIDLYNVFPKPHMYISRRMIGLEKYVVAAGTILVQNVGQRYGLFGRPTILPRHLDQSAVTQHLMRVYPADPRDRGFVYLWLATEFGRRMLLKQSFGTSMGVLFERSFLEMPVPTASAELRHSFEPHLQAMLDMQTMANASEEQAQALLAETLKMEVVT